jgi:hypothetical protein
MREIFPRFTPLPLKNNIAAFVAALSLIIKETGKNLRRLYFVYVKNFPFILPLPVLL